MKVSAIIGLTLLLVSSALLSQIERHNSYRIQSGTAHQHIDSEYNYFISLEQNIFSIKTKGKHVIIQKHDNYLLEETKKSIYKDLPKDAFLIGVFKLGIAHYLSYSLFTNNTTKVFVRAISFKETVLHPPKLLLERTGNTHVTITESNSNNKLLIHLYNDKKNNKFYVYDSDLVLEWSKKTTHRQSKAYSITSNSEVLLITTDFDSTIKDSKKNRDNPANYLTHYHKVSATTESKTLLRKITGNPSSIIIKENAKTEIVCTGYNHQGLFYFLLNGKEEILYSTINNLPWSNNLAMKEVLLQKDGNLIIIGEQYQFQIDHLIDSDGEPFTNYRNQYGYLQIIKLSKEGDEKWINSIPKTQIHKSFNPKPFYKGSLSYKYLHVEENHVFFYLDNRSNKDLPLESSVKTYDEAKPAVLTSIEINHDSGIMTKSIVFDTKYIGDKQVYQFSNEKMIQISPSEFVLELFQKKEGDIFYKITKNQ